MTAVSRLQQYVRLVQTRLRWMAGVRGVTATSLIAVALTLLFVLIADHYRFPPGLVLGLRCCFFGGVILVLAVAVIWPLRRLTTPRTVRLIESESSDFGERVLTVSERGSSAGPFAEFVAEEALAVAGQRPPEHFASTLALASLAVTAVAALSFLGWLIVAGPGVWGYGASLLWTGTHHGAEPLYAIFVEPGNKTVRRNLDQTISARLHGFSANHVVLHARYHAASKWETLPMQANQIGQYQFVFPGLSDDLEYYVEAEQSQSQQYRIHVKDLPHVVRIRTNVHYPTGIGLRDAVQDPGGDIRAVEGSEARIDVQTDRPMAKGFLVLDDGSKVELTARNDGWLSGQISIVKDGSYHIAAKDDEIVRVSDDYFIEAKKDEAPTVRITKPGRDPHVSPIEEVPITVEAADDFGVHSMQLHYSVNGGAEHVVPFSANGKDVTGKTQLAFEDFKLQPGDLVSLFATASDGSKTSRSDIVFAQAEAFDYQFRQSQQAGGGGQGGQEQAQISEREKEIIAATWNELKGGSHDQAQIGEHSKFLSDLQGKLGEQAQTMADRMSKRDLSSANAKFEEFSQLMSQASSQMTSAAQDLHKGTWDAALGPEQKSLQSLLRAESIFRDIQVAFGQSGGAGGGGGGAERDLARMFDLELDTAKNQYESGQTGGPGGGDQQKKLDEALQKLKELARRQQEMAQTPHNQQAFQQRWEQEQLRREAEQLRQQMEQASKQSQEGAEASASGSASGSASSASAAREATKSLERAEEQMRRAASQGDAGAQQRAQQELAQAQQRLEQSMQSQTSDALSNLAHESQDLAAKQQQLAENVKKQYGAQGINTAEADPESGGQRMPEMNGPGYASWYRRRFGLDQSKPATSAEKQLAAQAEQLSRQTADMQRRMQDQLQQLATADQAAGRALRKALSDAEQQELALRMQKGAEWLRSGHGSETWPLQDSVTAGMQELARQVGEAQQAMGSGSNGQDPAARALQNLQRFQQEIASGGTPDSGGAQQLRDDLQQLGRQDRSLQPYTAEALGAIRHATGQGGTLEARLGKDGLRSLERLEIELERRTASEDKRTARTGAREETPQEYKAAVAEYYRKLSK